MVDRGQGSIEQALEFIDHCVALGAGGVQMPIRTEPGFAQAIRAKVEAAGLFLEAQASLPHSEDDLDRFQAQVRAAREAGVQVIRTACLGGRRYETFKTAQAFADFARQAEQSLGWAEPIVRKHHVRLAVENHKDWQVPEFVALLGRLGSEFVGICIDTGNNIALLEDPMAVVEACAPYAFSTHLKDMAVQEYENGFLLAEVPLGDGFLNLPQIVSTLRRAKPGLHFNLEMITRDPLRIPCLTSEYWATFDSVPGRALAATLAMVRANRPRRPLPNASGLRQEEKLEAEELMVARSIAYAQGHLDL